MAVIQAFLNPKGGGGQLVPTKMGCLVHLNNQALLV